MRVSYPIPVRGFLGHNLDESPNNRGLLRQVAEGSSGEPSTTDFVRVYSRSLRGVNSVAPHLIALHHYYTHLQPLEQGAVFTYGMCCDLNNGVEAALQSASVLCHRFTSPKEPKGFLQSYPQKI